MYQYVKKPILFLLYWLSLSAAVVAQQAWPPVYVIKADSSFAADTSHFQVLEDPQGQYTFAQVQRSTAFRHDAPYNPNRKASVYWMRMRLRNDLTQDLNLYLCDFNSDYLDMYWLDSTNRWQHQRTGFLVPKSQQPDRNGNKERSRLFFRLKAGQQTTIYQRLENVLWHSANAYLVPQFQTEESVIRRIFTYIRVQNGWEDDWFAGIGIGILLLAVGYNLLIFFSTRERVYLYFGICLLFFILDRNIPHIQLAFFADQPYLFRFAANCFFIIFFIFFVQSIRRFIQPNAALVQLNRMTTIALGIMILLNLAALLLTRQPDLFIRKLDIGLELIIRVIYGLCLMMTYRMMKQGATDARFVFIAILPLFLWWMYTLSTQIIGLYYQISLSNYLPDIFTYPESICLSWMIIFFSGALINRYNLTRQQMAQQAIEKEQLEKEREIERNRIIASQNERLEQQVRERTAELQQSLETLKETQNQLVQKEKLASLGELTAGIAHEIQNPLNFVNNFSEVNLELIDELHEERRKDNRDEELESEILNDLGLNLQKINQHGKRAGAIVRGMLEHSRTSTGEKQLTNLNALAEEYLRLAYHGLRTKDKTFNCQLITNFEPALPNVAVVTSDIGRMLMNLYTNAFYAVQERQKKLLDSGESADLKDYQPTVWVSTHLSNKATATSADDANVIDIHVRDNGTGIADAVKQKIFQPFFTTKPTGQGTGLGLSLAYDIVTKGHDGELTVNSHEGDGAELVIRLPVK